jgi:hypothetical protein
MRISMNRDKLFIGMITALTDEMDCDQTAMGLPSVTSAVFLIAKLFW